MCSGEIHPFTHNSKGESLLHIAAQEYRLDICRIVSAHGLKPDYTHSGRTPFHYSLNTRNQPPEGPVDMYRFLIHTLEQIDDFTSEFWVYYISPILQTQAGTEWFLRFTKNELPTEDMCKIQLLFLKKLVGFFAHDYGVPESYWGELSVVAALLDDRVVDQIASGKSGLLKQLFSCDMPSSYSQGVGAVYIGLLHSLRIDVEHCVREEMSKLQGGIIRAAFGQVANKQIVFERTVTQGWVLRWEYIPDHIDTPGYLLTKEFTALTFNVLPRHVWTWPFCEVYWKFPYENRAREDTKWTLRFSRRIAAKARKERVRLGQKRPRSRMPGSWVA
ncbi:hypothetical protein E8E12_006427 [Didymella heteroderae]|uniref:Uncharacterized protein n=1 Tax=Didymella heteroderae TaxID=1769908 RepID=A0A9P5C396_9PLEO|nr:hypothetical protein E8E12_006427 [Didymella heteroderae]